MKFLNVSAIITLLSIGNLSVDAQVGGNRTLNILDVIH